MGTTTGLVTFEEFERMPEEEDVWKIELIDGELLRLPPAITQHMRIGLRVLSILMQLLRELHSHGQGRDLGEGFHEAGYRIGSSNWLVPDVSITRAGQTEGKYLEGAPALAIEVISEANTARTTHRKVREFLANGSREVWVFSPETNSVWVFRGKTGVEIEGALTSELLPGASIDLTKVFAG